MAKAAKETFWNKERLKRGWSIDYVAKKLGVPKGTIGNWFSGTHAPRDDNEIQAICNLFGIDFDTGYNAFYRAERTWKSSRNCCYYGDSNFWADLRLKNKKSFTELSKETGIHKATLSFAFSGKHMPHDEIIKSVCHIFGVDFNEGKEEFRKAHEAYVAKKKNKLIDITEVAKLPEPDLSSFNISTEETSTEFTYDFWPSKLRSGPFDIHGISQYLNVDDKKVTDYFLGRKKPNFNQIRMLCNLYGGIDLLTGTKAFDLLHQRYNSGDDIQLEPVYSEDGSVTVPEPIDKSVDIFEIIYGSGKISYKDFLSIYQLVAEKNEKEALRLLYKQLDFEEYYTIAAELSKWCK